MSQLPFPNQNPYDPTGGLLGPDMLKYMKQQRLFGLLGNIGRGLMQAGAGNADFGPGLLMGLGNANAGGGQGQGGLLDMLKMQQYMQGQQDRQEKKGRQAKQDYSRSALTKGGYPAGPDPRTGIDWNTPRQGGVGLLESERKGLLGEAYPEAYGRAQMAQAFPKPQARKTATDVAGYRRYLDTGDRAFPGAEKPAVPQYGGAPQFDAQVGKFYQVNPKTKKREYTSPQTGMEITTPEGLTIRTGVRTGGAGGMQKKTRGDIEKKLVGAREGLTRLRGIAAKFKPEFQEIPTRLGVAWTGLKARFGKGGVSSEDRQALTEFADYRRDAISNINLYIKDITGAQMSATETDRLRLATPDPGEGIFGGDDPITFEAKLGSAIQDIEKATVRYEHYLSQGITDPEVMARQSPLDQMSIAENTETGELIIEIGGQWVPLQ